MKRLLRFSLCGLLVVSAWLPSAAEDPAKRWRVSLALGNLNAQDEIESDAANVFDMRNRLDFSREDLFVDPRNDSAAFGNLEIKPDSLTTLAAQYAVTTLGTTATFIVEGSISYQKTDVGDVEIQAQYDGIEIDPQLNFNFIPTRITVGELERVPIWVTGIFRFRPRASFNPYVGAGVGYSLIGFEPDPAFDELSRNLDASVGGEAHVSSALLGVPAIQPSSSGDQRDLTGAQVDARDTVEWLLVGGAEYSVRRKWALFMDFRYTFASRTLNIGFNGGGDLGVAVPQLTDFSDSTAALNCVLNCGPMDITEGGLVDGGSLQPRPGEDPELDCSDPMVQQQGLCFFDPETPDGEVDTGFYYVQGGRIKYDAFSAQIGVRFTF